MLFVCAWLVSLRVRNYERGQARRPPHHEAQPAPAHARLPRRRVDADAPARPGRRPDALASSTSGSSGCSSRRSCSSSNHQLPDNLKFLHGGVYQGYAFAADLGGRRLHRRHRVGDRPPLHRAPVPHPDQDQARGRGDPRHVPRDRGHRLLHRGAAHRARRPSRLREVVVRRLPDLVAVRLVVGERRSSRRTGGCGACTSSRSSRSW